MGIYKKIEDNFEGLSLVWECMYDNCFGVFFFFFFFVLDFLWANIEMYFDFTNPKPGKRKKKKHTYAFEEMEEKNKALNIGNI